MTYVFLLFSESINLGIPSIIPLVAGRLYLRIQTSSLCELMHERNWKKREKRIRCSSYIVASRCDT
jgi:hypothetical protein